MVHYDIKKKKKRNWCACIIGCDINRFVLVECGKRIVGEKNVTPSACKYIIQPIYTIIQSSLGWANNFTISKSISRLQFLEQTLFRNYVFFDKSFLKYLELQRDQISVYKRIILNKNTSELLDRGIGPSQKQTLQQYFCVFMI